MLIHSTLQISKLGEKRFENPQTTNLHRILMGCIFIHELMAEHNTTEEDKQEQKKKQVSLCVFLYLYVLRMFITPVTGSILVGISYVLKCNV